VLACTRQTAQGDEHFQTRRGKPTFASLGAITEKPVEIAKAVVLPTSDEGSFVASAELVVDGRMNAVSDG
jgi:hypothetical protein